MWAHIHLMTLLFHARMNKVIEEKTQFEKLGDKKDLYARIINGVEQLALSSVSCYGSQLVPYTCTSPKCCHSPETVPDTSVFLQYHSSNGTVSAVRLLKKGTYLTSTDKLRCDVYECTFIAIHLWSGIASHLPGKVYIFNKTNLSKEKGLGYTNSDMSAINTQALCPYTYSSSALSISECSYLLSESISDRELIPACSPSVHHVLCSPPPRKTQQCSLQFVLGIKIERLVFLPSQNHSSVVVSDFNLIPIHPTSISSTAVISLPKEVTQGQFVGSSQHDSLNQPHIRAPVSDKLTQNCHSNPNMHIVAKATIAASKARCGVQEAPYDQVHFTKKKRGNSINFKKGLMVTNMKCPVQESTIYYSCTTSHTTSVFRGENNLHASSSSDSEGDSSASSDSNSEEEVRRKPQHFTSVPLALEESQKSTKPHHGHTSSYGGNTDDANLSATSAVGRRAQPQASNLKSVLQPTEETCDSSCSVHIPVVGACGFQWLQIPKASHHAVQEESCSTPPVPTSYPCGLNQRDSDGSSSSDNYLGNFNELIEADYGIPRLDCVDDFKVSLL